MSKQPKICQIQSVVRKSNRKKPHVLPKNPKILMMRTKKVRQKSVMTMSDVYWMSDLTMKIFKMSDQTGCSVGRSLRPLGVPWSVIGMSKGGRMSDEAVLMTYRMSVMVTRRLELYIRSFMHGHF